MKKTVSNTIQNYRYWIFGGSGLLILFAILINQYQQSQSDQILLNPNLRNLLSEENKFSTHLIERIKKPIEELCFKNLMLLRNNSLASLEWLEQFKISVHEELVHEKQLIKNSKLLKRAFYEIITEESYLPNIINTESFRIILRSQESMNQLFGQGSFGDYDILYDLISIAYNPHATLQDYKQQLRNELFSQQIVFKNLLILNGTTIENKLLLATPVLDNNGKIDQAKLNKLEQSIETGLYRIHTLLKYFNAPAEFPQQITKANKLRELSKSFTPSTRYISIEQYESYVAKGLFLKANSQGIIEPGPNFPVNLKKEYAVLHEDSVQIFNYPPNNPPEKAIILLNVILKQKDTMDIVPNYKFLPKPIKLSEFLSFLAENPEAERLLFPEVSEFMEKFFCDIPEKIVSDKPNKKITSFYNPLKLKVSMEKKSASPFHSEDRKRREKDQAPTAQKSPHKRIEIKR